MKIVLLLTLLSVGESDVSRTVSGQTGEDVTLPCKYNVKTHGLLSVCWKRGAVPLSGCGNQLVAADKLTVREDTRVSSRYQLLGRLNKGDVSLTILNLTETDAGQYGCRVIIPGPFNDGKYHIDLIIDRAPQMTTSSSLNRETSMLQTTASQTQGQMTTTWNILTSSSESSSIGITAESSSSVTVALVPVFVVLIVLVTVGIIIGKWQRLNKIHQQQQQETYSSVQFSFQTLQLEQNRSGALENIYQIDGSEYEFCP